MMLATLLPGEQCPSGSAGCGHIFGFLIFFHSIPSVTSKFYKFIMYLLVIFNLANPSVSKSKQTSKQKKQVHFFT